MTRFAAPRRIVLVVEDESLVRLDAALFLRDAGCEVLEAADAEEALEVVEEHPVDVLFTDINMPGSISGLELARRVKETRPAVKLVLTSGAIKPKPDQIPDQGAFLPKPYSPEAVARAVLSAD